MFSDVLLSHLDRYPKMQLQDCVKLAYQAEFGPGHLLRDSARALNFLRQEMASAQPNGDPLYLPIGNGLCRVSLPACVQRGLSPEQVFDLFARAALTVKGDKRLFHKTLREIPVLIDEGLLPYDGGEADIFLIQYEDKGCPPLHHSDAYRQAYHPAYRVVWQKQFKDLLHSLG